MHGSAGLTHIIARIAEDLRLLEWHVFVASLCSNTLQHRCRGGVMWQLTQIKTPAQLHSCARTTILFLIKASFCIQALWGTVFGCEWIAIIFSP